MAETPGTTTGTTRSTGTTARKTSATKRSTAAKKGTATRRRTQAQRSAARPAATKAPAPEARTPVAVVTSYAEKAVVIPVGAALVARDNVIETVTELREKYSTPAKAQRAIETDLRKFERRGTSARRSVEREVKKARTRVERLLRQRRTRLERTVKRNRTRFEREARATRKDLIAQAELAGARVENLVQTGVTAGTAVAAKVSERVNNGGAA
jgi:hypothetical protein